MDYKWKWISIGTASSIFMLSHIGMIGMISRQSKFPVVNVPVGAYTSYKVAVSYTHLTVPTILLV